MTGRVGDGLDATLTIRLRASEGGGIVSVAATIDTGFTDYLLVSQEVVRLLKLVPLEQDSVILGDGSVAQLDVHQLDVEWEGVWRTVEVFAGDEVLIGVSLLEGLRLCVDFMPGGEVRVEAI